jgi:hypothetical protein
LLYPRFIWRGLFFFSYRIRVQADLTYLSKAALLSAVIARPIAIMSAIAASILFRPELDPIPVAALVDFANHVAQAPFQHRIVIMPQPPRASRR